MSPPPVPLAVFSLLRWLGLLAALATACVPKEDSPIRLNEILAANSDGCPDEVGERNDWIELFNTSDAAIDLGGHSLTDDSATPDKSIIPGGVTIEARGALLFWLDGTPDQGKTHLTFKLKSKAERVILYDPYLRQIDIYPWTDAYSDISFARVPDGTGEWFRCAEPTCGAPNSSTCGR